MWVPKEHVEVFCPEDGSKIFFRKICTTVQYRKICTTEVGDGWEEYVAHFNRNERTALVWL